MTAALPILRNMEDPELIELERTVGDRYEIKAAEDGRMILTPKLTAAARRTRLGGRPVTDQEFEAAFGDLPTGPA